MRSTEFDFSALHEQGVERIGELNPYITLACDLRCRYCYMFDFLERATDNTQLMEPRYLFDLVEHLNKVGGEMDRLTLLGGEPTLHPRVTEIANEIASMQVRERRMTTNAMGLHYLNLDKLKANAFDHVSVSIDGTTAATNDLTRGNHAFEKIVETLSLYKQAGVNMSVNYTVTNNNIDQLDDVVPFFSDMGVSIVNFHRASVDGNAYNHLDLIVEPIRWVQARERLVDYLRRRGKDFPGVKVRIPYTFLTPQEIIGLNYQPIQERNYHSPEGGHRLIVFPPTGRGRGLCYMSSDLIGQAGAELGTLGADGKFVWNERITNELTAYRGSPSSNISTDLKGQDVGIKSGNLVRVSHSFKAEFVTGTTP